MNVTEEVQTLREEVEKIKSRNKRVEADKAWETSWARKTFVAAITYILVVILFVSINVEKPFASAVIPAIAYLISTFSLGIVKRWWLARRKN